MRTVNNGKICISVCAETADDLFDHIARARPMADIVEIRFDFMDKNEIEKTINRADEKWKEYSEFLLATFRPLEQGGSRPISDIERSEFWFTGNERIFWAGDFEEDIIEESYYRLWFGSICSFHDHSGTLSDVDKVYDRLSAATAANAKLKIAVTVRDISDSIPVWKLLQRAKDDEKNIIPIAMGEAGKWTRILGLAHDAYMTYASLDEGEETADGQITAKDLIEVYRVKELDKNTDVYGVIGDPVSTSKSPYMHNAAFAETGINAVFLPLLVKDLDEFIRRMVAPSTREVELNFAGFSVTMPHKQAIMKHLDEIDETAKQIGAVNTVKIVDDKLIGYNTDAHGFVTPLRIKFGDLKNVRVAVIGAGGAARACVYALTQEGAEATICARDKTKAELFAQEFNAGVRQFTSVDSFDIVVNATPLGMKGALEDKSPLTADQLKGVKFVYDLVTRADDTPLVSAAKKVGIPAIGGLEMLIAQGVKQFEIWTGREAPTELMRQSVMARLNK